MNGEDTFARFAGPFGRIRMDRPSRDASFFAGALSHVGGDVTIHPAVNYFCNSPIAESRIRSARLHRAFESCMDIAACNQFGRPGSTENGLSGLLRSMDTEELGRLAAEFYGGIACIDARRAVGLISRHAWIRDRFERTGWRRSARFIGSIGGEGIKVMAATFYPVRRSREVEREVGGGFFGESISYRNPRSGEWHKKTLDELIDSAADYSADLLEEVADATNPDNRGAVFSSRKGPSLAHGVDVERYGREIYFGTAENLQCPWYTTRRID